MNHAYNLELLEVPEEEQEGLFHPKWPAGDGWRLFYQQEPNGRVWQYDGDTPIGVIAYAFVRFSCEEEDAQIRSKTKAAKEAESLLGTLSNNPALLAALKEKLA